MITIFDILIQKFIAKKVVEFMSVSVMLHPRHFCDQNLKGILNRLHVI